MHPYREKLTKEMIKVSGYWLVQIEVLLKEDIYEVNKSRWNV
jgi:hypothetical protein